MKYLNSNEAALIMGVNVSTIKRWTDSGILPCFQTPGGHRKFTLKHINKFLLKNNKKTNKVNIFEINKINDKYLIHNIGNCNYTVLQSLLFTYAITAEEKYIKTIITGLYLKGIPIYEIYDLLVLPVLHKIGEEWVCDNITIPEEHLASEVIRKAIYNLGESLETSHKVKDGFAICFSIAGDNHELPLIMTKQILEQNSIKTFNLGTNVPVKDFSQMVLKTNPNLIIVSINYTENTQQLNSELNELLKLSKVISSKILVGGGAVAQINKKNNAYILKKKNMYDLYKTTSGA